MVLASNSLFINSLNIKQEDLKNKLFCTFSTKEGLDKTIETIKGEYVVAYNKIFILESPDSDEYLCTYNIEITSNITPVLRNTILLHRKKESNTLYTINSLNALIKSLNNGILDTGYQVNWNDYRNSVLLTTGNELRRLNTAIYKIISL